jgi:hypothetical protein
MKIYLAGPVSSMPDYNRAAFARAADRLREEGHSVFNPTAANLEDGRPLRKIMSYLLIWLCEEADAIALLPGYRRSGGAMIEYMLAKYLGLKIIKL